MNILAFDTTTGICSVALLSHKNTYYADGASPSSQAEKLFLLIQNVLSQAEITYQQLDKIVVTTGPGSFTGVRIGLAAAKGIALATNIPLTGISSLEAIAWEAMLASNHSHPILVALDARRNQVYAQLFDENAIALQPAALLNLDEIKNYTNSTNYILAGNATQLITPFLSSPVSSLTAITIPRAAIMALAAVEKQPSSDIVEAFYIREPDAKIKKPTL